MSAPSGHPQSLGPYSIERELGRGGMGIVLLGRDPRLDRRVALKLLPEELGGQPDRLARFEREARILASLNHPQIAGIYGVEEAEGTRFLVLEYVEGETLAERLARGPLAVGDALEVCRQIAGALEAAHEAGVIHRDLKPANVVLTPQGDVKILDFGLAKGEVQTSSGSDLSFSPTLSLGATAAGVILGSAAYMSPEQARGKPLDRRTDIWSFGCVLYECLTGERLFGAETVSDSIARILERPVDLSNLPERVPQRVTGLLSRCLEKDHRRRLRDLGDARIELEEALAESRAASAASVSQPAVPTVARRRWIPLAAVALAGLVLGAIGMRLVDHLTGGSVPETTTRLSISGLPGLELLSADPAPSGRLVLILARDRDAGDQRPSLYLRRLDGFELRPVAESEGAVGYDFSPDSRWLYFAGPVAPNATQLRLARMPVDGGSAPVTVRPWSDGWGPWTLLADGDVLTTTESGRQFLRLPSDGGPPGAPRPIDAGGLLGQFTFTGERLPGGRSVLLDVSYYGARGYQQGVAALDLASGKAHLLIEDAMHGVWVPGDRLVFGRGDALLVAPFEPRRLELTGAPRAVLTGVRTADPGNPYPRFHLAEGGTLVYPPGGRVGSARRLVVVDRAGRVDPWSDERMAFQGAPSIAALGDRLAETVMEANGLLFEIWVSDLAHPSLHRLVSRPRVDGSLPLLSPDGRRLAYQRNGNTSEDGLYLLPVDGGAEEQRLAARTPTATWLPSGWAPDGSYLLATRATDGPGLGDVVEIPLGAGKPGTPRDLVATRFDERDAVVSPDGRWIALTSNESGRDEVYARRLGPEGSVGPALPVSRGQGANVRWRPDGKAILFWDERGRIMEAGIETEPRFVAAPPRQLVDLRDLGLTPGYDVLPDGRLLFVAKDDNEGEIDRFDVVLGLTRELASSS